MSRFMPYGIALLLGVLAFVASEAYRRGAASREPELRALALTVDSLEAAIDTTRLVLGDSLRRVQERRVVQVTELERQRDAALRQLRGERKVTADLIAIVDEARGSAAAAQAEGDSADVRRASFQVASQSPPGTLTADVEMPAPPDSARLGFAFALDPIPMTVDDVCGEPVAEGRLRPASVRVTTPPWVNVQVQAAQQVVDICNPLTPRMPSRATYFAAGAGTALALIGAVLILIN